MVTQSAWTIFPNKGNSSPYFNDQARKTRSCQSGTDEMLADTLRQALAEQGAMVSLVEVQRVIAIPKTAAGKAPLIKSNLSQATIPPGAQSSWFTPSTSFPHA